MPLITKCEIIDVRCLCGAVHNNYAGHYAHLGECPIDRCAHCLRMLGGTHGDDPKTHQCPKLIS